MKLLSSGKSNTKLAKNTRETYYLSLQPTNLNSKGENLCRFSTKECRTQCLQFAGRQGFSNVVQSRERKTEFFVQQREEFLKQLWDELAVLNDKGGAAVRLNLLSDVDWQREFIYAGRDMRLLNKIQFYDYTKDHVKILNNKLRNYHLTLSYSGSNWVVCELVLSLHLANVAVVFKDGPKKGFKGYPVLDGDINDERYLDPLGHIVGLKYKTPHGVKYVKNKFVIE